MKASDFKVVKQAREAAEHQLTFFNKMMDAKTTPNVRVLTVDDYPQVESLMESRTKFLGVPDELTATHRYVSLNNALDLLKTGQGMGRIFGLFEDQQLMGMIFTLISASHPCYYVNKAYTRPTSSPSTLSSIFEYLIEYYEKLGYQRFYTMYRASDVHTYHKLWKTSKTLLDYIQYTDLQVEPNIRPKHSDFWELLFGRMLFNTTMVVRGFVRKSESTILNICVGDKAT